jgi:hypothetical protein
VLGGTSLTEESALRNRGKLSILCSGCSDRYLCDPVRAKMAILEHPDVARLTLRQAHAPSNKANDERRMTKPSLRHAAPPQPLWFAASTCSQRTSSHVDQVCRGILCNEPSRVIVLVSADTMQQWKGNRRIRACWKRIEQIHLMFRA